MIPVVFSMKIYLRLFVILMVAVFLAPPALAKDQFLVKATNDQDKSVDELSLRIDKSGRLTHLLHIPSGRAQIAYSPGQLKSGVVLRQKSGRDLVTLKMQQFSPDSGAKVLLTYLYSAVPVESYRSLTLELTQDKDGWFLKDSKGSRVGSMHIKANIASVMGYRQAVGIQALELRAK